jgi:hypothetical protein
MTSFYPVQFFAEDEPAPFNFEEQPAQPVQLNVYPVKSLLHLFLWGELSGIARLFNRDGIFVAFIPSG